MTSKTTTKANRKTATRTARKKSNRINRQRRLQKQLQILLFERHSRRCIICHHPEREAIEEEFVHWRAPWKLSQDYNLNDYRTVYRHARAAGLLLQRRERLHSALDAFVESVDDVTFTGDTILRAMRAYSCIDSHGRWTEIPTQVQFSTSNDAQPPQPPTPSPRSGSTASDILDVAPKYSNQPSRSDATTCASPPAQAFNEETKKTCAKSASPLPTSSTCSANTAFKHRGTMPPPPKINTTNPKMMTPTPIPIPTMTTSQKRTLKTSSKSSSPLPTSATSSANTPIKHRGAMPPSPTMNQKKPQKTSSKSS